MEIVFATGNHHKLQEVNEIAGDENIKFILPEGDFSPVENGVTFAENAYIKALAAHKPGYKSLADDSGLCVDALDGAPGLYSARYAESQNEKISKLLDQMKNINNRSAKFVCAMVLLDENGEKIFETTKECHGSISTSPCGNGGFGFDPLFVVQNKNYTMAELSEEEKNKISHRGLALKSVIEFLNNKNSD